MDREVNASFLVLIAERNHKDAILSGLSTCGALAIDTLYGKGSAHVKGLLGLLGFEPENNKVVITCLVAKAKIEIIEKMLVEEFDFNSPNTGIAFTVPVEKLSV